MVVFIFVWGIGGWEILDAKSVVARRKNGAQLEQVGQGSAVLRVGQASLGVTIPVPGISVRF